MMRAWLTMLAAVVGVAALMEAGRVGRLPGEEPTTSRAPWQRLLQGSDAKKAAELHDRVMAAWQASQWEEALRIAQELLELRQKVQGKDHWQAVQARWQVAALRAVLRQGKEVQKPYSTLPRLDEEGDALQAIGRYRQAEPLRLEALEIRRKVLGEEHPDTAQSYNNVAFALNAQGKYAAAAEASRKALDICRKVLGAEHPLTATSYNTLGLNLHPQGQYAAAEDSFRKALAIRLAVLGEEHVDTAESYNNVAANLHTQGHYAAAEEFSRKALAILRKVFGEEHRNTATCYATLATNLDAQGKYAAAEEGFRKALAIRRKVLGDEHPETASSYNNLAANLHAQGQYAAAEELYRKALEIHRKVLGEEHPHTATCYNNVALSLHYLGQYVAAEDGLRKALAIYRKVLGEDHPETANSYASVAFNLNAQGQYAAAEEGYRKALVIYRKVVGEEHPDTANSYDNLAINLYAQGQYAAAEELCRKALAIRRKVLGEEHPHTAASYNSLAANLEAQGQYAAADEVHRKALAIRRKVLGEEHPDTATCYNNLAFNLNTQGKYAAAEEGFRKALAINRKVLGEEHSLTATNYNNLAINLNAQGRYEAAEEGYRKALEIQRKVLGEEHPLTATTYNNLAFNLNAQGRYAEAERLWVRAAAAFASARTRLAHSGLERAAITSERSPLPDLAAVLARNGKQQAWQRYEESLARGTWDDLSARLRRPAAEQARQAALSARLDRLDQLIEQAVAVYSETPQHKEQRDDLLSQRRKTQEELDALVTQLEKTHGAAAGQVFDTARIQTALADDMALLGWLDRDPAGPKAADPNGEHWAFLLRSKGEPVCVRLRGSGEAGAWTEQDSHLPAELRTAVQERRDGWQRLAERLSQQRLGPLGKHLGAHESLPAVKRLVVLPSSLLAGVPVELLAEGYTVNYAHSGTLFAHLRSQPKVTTQGLFAVADPVFQAPAAAVKEKPLPPGGVLLTLVLPGSNAAAARLRPGEVLLTYNGKPVEAAANLAPLIAAAAEEKAIDVTVWREDSARPLHRKVGPGKLGVVLADRPAPEAIADLRRRDRRLAVRGDDEWRELPGTRAEVASLTRLFGDAPASLVLTDSDASEQKLHELAKSGTLKKYRYLHLATHGEVNDTFPLRSAVILSRDALPDPQQQLLRGQPVFDGRLTAEEVLRLWQLDCDLVTLSACQTALGKYENGEGFVGFAQALTLCGSRSVCLSLWKVDDAATALLMERFYANLLGKRQGLKAPLPKSQALAEARQWLRTLPREQVLEHAAGIYAGVARGKGRLKLLLVPPLPERQPEAKEDCPYAHPYYWAAFVLTGDAD
jgi:tetratricopeptide (TPR) repeat protein